MAQRPLLNRVLEFFTTASDTLINRVRVHTRRWRSSYRQPTNDWARADYAFYRRLYYGRAVGLELSGLLVRPIVSKLSAWTLGRVPRWNLDSETSQQALADWWAAAHPQILRGWRGALKEADAFVVVNSDLSITLLPADAVDPIVADDDFANVIGWRVTQVLSHPDTTQRMTVIDEYYADRRIHRVEVDGRIRETSTYPNLLGRAPIVHIANQPDTGETFGHAEAEALLPLMHKYGEVFEAAIEGNVLQGRPTPVLAFETVQDLEKFDEENATFETQQLSNGRSQRVKTYDVDLSQLLVASGATFTYESPGSFTADTAKLLEVLFYLILEHSELPEFVFGNAISSSKASAETQMPIFERFVEMRRGEMVGWMTDIAEIALGYLALITPGVTVETPSLQWQAITQDERMTLDSLIWAYTENLIDRRTALMLCPLDVDDLDGVLEAADQERAARAVTAQAIAAPQATEDNADNADDTDAEVNEMFGTINELEATAIVNGAIKQLAGVGHTNGHA